MKIFTCLLLLLAVYASAPSRVEATRRQHAGRTKTSNADSGMDLEMPSALPVAPMFSSERGMGRGKGTRGRRGMQELDGPADSTRNRDDTARGSSSLDPGLGVLPSTNEVPANDLCVDAIEVPCGGEVDVTSLCAGLADPPFCRSLVAFVSNLSVCQSTVRANQSIIAKFDPLSPSSSQWTRL